MEEPSSRKRRGMIAMGVDSIRGTLHWIPMSQLGDRLNRVLKQHQPADAKDEKKDSSATATLRRLIAALAECEPDALRPSTRLREDLHFDRLDFLELTVKVENTTGHRIDDVAIFQGATVADVLAYASDEVAAGGGSGTVGSESR